MSTDIGERKDPPCDCAEQIEGRWVSRCYCSNRDDGERTAAWCVEANTAAEIAKLRAEVERLTAIIAAADRGTPIYKAIERTLDEKSAWIARPSDDVTQAVALTAGIAWSIHYPLELVEQNLSLQLDNHLLRAEVERLRDMVRRAYNDGFGEGMREHTTHRGGLPWSMSKWPAALTESTEKSNV